MIRKNMSMREIVQKYPETLGVFDRFGLGCAGCRAALFDSVEEGAKAHGINVETLIKSLNSVIEVD